jgi:hypothetical protein
MKYLLKVLAIILWFGFAGAAAAELSQKVVEPPVVAIIIDDMGNRLQDGHNALNLPGAITYSFLPHTPHAWNMAKQAHARGKQVMLHLPMEAHSGKKLGAGGVDQYMSEKQLRQALIEGLKAVPHVVGLNNHMGSLLTQRPDSMGWLMQGIREYEGAKLFFVDSRTTSLTVAERLARENQIPTVARDVFLDNERNPEYIRAQFQQLIRRARSQGQAIAIAHPYPETIATLAEELAKLEATGVRLVSVSQILQTKPY